jgi:hypothetical protein
MAVKKEPHDIRLATVCHRYEPQEGRTPLKKTCLSCAHWEKVHCRLKRFVLEEIRLGLKLRAEKEMVRHETRQPV